MLEKSVIEHCSPTLASIKTGNLFTYKYESEEKLWKSVDGFNECVKEKGVSLTVLRKSESKALIYVCRSSSLEKDLKKPGVANFMKKYGYESTDPSYALERLRSRLAQREDFPHEIGLFLGYPLGDVIGFVKNAGQNCKCVGCWKVYCNECEAVKAFAKFKKCTSVYVRLWSQGRSVRQLTVAA
ncbi:DUF3793 family protein [Blautia luti]|jgi:hypothetical protein|uniref:DUF3793 family protein n=1 Tax=Blautia luti DSM 14534 = JCM 17040 TaxID=649762 RepID=A0A844GN41_9FIRM|nr:DUF3793 family protein [Blautia luti]MTD61657.1 DUF3793 family protein [Blautia luti DSM 14534 = JCM 17040]RHQ93369.1 DUF3793 family protein [Ruminococcus sp. AF21-42]BEI61061.1 DUF3793 family protein [Blautia luti]